MSKTAVVYWSGTGNTEQMAQAVAEGAREKGSDCALFSCTEFEPSTIGEYDAIAFGCPSMGVEELEDSEFEPMFSSCESELKNKRIALFGSFGWGDGEWMRNWEETCIGDGAILVCDSVICCETPDDDAIEQCKALGASLA